MVIAALDFIRVCIVKTCLVALANQTLGFRNGPLKCVRQNKTKDENLLMFSLFTDKYNISNKRYV